MRTTRRRGLSGAGTLTSRVTEAGAGTEWRLRTSWSPWPLPTLFPSLPVLMTTSSDALPACLLTWVSRKVESGKQQTCPQANRWCSLQAGLQAGSVTWGSQATRVSRLQDGVSFKAEVTLPGSARGTRAEMQRRYRGHWGPAACGHTLGARSSADVCMSVTLEACARARAASGISPCSPLDSARCTHALAATESVMRIRGSDHQGCGQRL